jgi:acyl-CoA thioester hydrolase
MTSPFTVTLAVRDYECDYEGIVNNAVYLHYLEHARHEFLKSAGLRVADLAKQGVNLVVIRAEVDYLWPLRSGDQFETAVGLERQSRLRFVFVQSIARLPDHKPILNARITGTSIDAAGRPRQFKEVDALLARLLPHG